MALLLQTRGRPLSMERSSILGRVVRDPGLVQGSRDRLVFLSEREMSLDSEGFAAVLMGFTLDDQESAVFKARSQACFDSLKSTEHLRNGDVVAIYPNGFIKTLYRPASRTNALFMTERCNSYCIMCSQPPREVDDSHLIVENLQLIEHISESDPSCQELGITGGEPTLLKEGFIAIVASCAGKLPGTALHVLSNGRAFAEGDLAKRLAEIRHPNLMLGIPLYAPVGEVHDYVVQVKGAFDETVAGIFKLERNGVAVEIRCVVHRKTYRLLPDLARYIYRSLTFVRHVALMGLEVMGFGHANIDELWIDPWDYQKELADAALFLARSGISVSIYNIPLCLLPREVWFLSRQSISDWKNDFMDECEGCAVRASCAGFFSSSLRRRHSSHVRPIGVKQFE